MTAAAGKKKSVSLSFFMEVNNLEVEEELSSMATLAWADRSWMGRWARAKKRLGGRRFSRFRRGGK